LPVIPFDGEPGGGADARTVGLRRAISAA